MKKFDVKIEIRPAKGALDPQGKTVHSALKRLGFNGVSAVSVGKLIELKFQSEDLRSARKTARRMCEDFLANPIIEEFSMDVRQSGD